MWVKRELNIFNDFLKTVMKVLPGLACRKAPRAAPPMIITSKGWISAMNLPPDRMKPPSTLPNTTKMPRIFAMGDELEESVGRVMQNNPSIYRKYCARL
ncbi:hypothetical protein D3C78_1587310 [compost metagenome]